MTYMPRSALSASPAGGGTDLAAELSVNRRIRGAESFSESQALFTARTKRQVAVESDIARLRELAESLGVTDVDALEPSRIDETVADLAASGADSQVVGQMRDLAASVSEQQSEILDLTRRLNTGNGEQFAILEGLRINDDFRGEAIDQRPVDSPVHALALSPAGNQLVVVEYQGAAPTIDDDDETDLSLDSLENCCLGEGRGNEDDGDVRAGLLHSLSYGTEDVQLDVGAVLRLVGDGGASLASVHAAHNVGACCEHACGVLGTLATGDALNDDLGVLVHKDRHITSLKSFAGDYAL